ncbi:sorting nexin-11-like [Rhinoraja longicauda]
MMNDQEEEEFITVRVQDPQIQDQNSWASYVDYKIFLYTNSKAFTVKSSCVRRRYREFEWLRRRLQKNAGLVSLPELPGKKPFLQVNDTEGIERRRQGLQQFLQKVLYFDICKQQESTGGAGILTPLVPTSSPPPSGMPGRILSALDYFEVWLPVLQPMKQRFTLLLDFADTKEKMTQELSFIITESQSCSSPDGGR